MTILLCGSNGQLGKSILVSSKNIDNIIKINKKDLDISDFKRAKFYFEKYKPSIVINAAGYTNVDKAETEEEKAYKANCLGPRNLAYFANIFNSLLIHFSTDYVFDGSKNKPYKENDKMKPISVYGKTKMFGEEEIIKSKCKYLIIRVSWLYSHFNNMNFLNKMIELSKSKSEIDIVSDQKGIPTSSLELSKNLWKIIDECNSKKNKLYSGIYHFSQNGKTISFYEFAKFIFDYMSKNNFIVPKIKPILSSNYNKKIIRPLFSGLDNDKLSKEFNLNIEKWQLSLKYILQLKLKNL